MRKKITVTIITAALLVTGVWFTPQADELEVSVGEELLTEPVETLTEPEGESLVESGVDLVGGSSDELIVGGSDDVIEISDGEDGNGEIVIGDDNDSGDIRLSEGDEDDIRLSDEDTRDVVPDEPDNVVDSSEDDYYETDPAYIYDDRPFDASYITGQGVDRIRKVIVAYAESLGGTFRSPYYKGGQAVSIQCCAYVNQVWKHVFGKDIYDTGVMTTTSHESETIYDFLERTGARAGDILYVRYWKVKKDDWSSHFMILLDYDRTGVYVTDGYETDDGKFLVWRIDKKAVYSQSNFFKKTGSDKDKPNSRHWTGKNGSFFKLYRMRQEEWCKVANSTYDEYETDPIVRSSFTRVNRPEGTYTITSLIHSTNGLDRVQFPVWTVAGGEDDLMPDYETAEAASGQIEALDDDMYRVTYTVDIADHNNECGNYMAEMYMYDTMGVLITYQCDAVNMDGVAGSICIDPISWSLE